MCIYLCECVLVFHSIEYFLSIFPLFFAFQQSSSRWMLRVIRARHTYIVTFRIYTFRLAKYTYMPIHTYIYVMFRSYRYYIIIIWQWYIHLIWTIYISFFRKVYLCFTKWCIGIGWLYISHVYIDVKWKIVQNKRISSRFLIYILILE